MVKQLACLFMIFLQIGGVFAQAPLTISATILEVDSADYPQITAYLRVYDRDRLVSLKDLSQTDIFAATDTGDPLRVVSLKPSERPLQVVAIADLTGSVSASELENQKRALQGLATWLRPNDEMALLGMDHEKVETLHPLTADKNNILRALDLLAPRADVVGNVYWDGVQAGISLLEGADSQTQKVIILLTDISPGGGAGTANEESIITAAIASHIHIFGLYFDYEGDGIPDASTPLPTEITALTEATGGLAWGVSAQLRGDDYTDDEALPSMMQTLMPLILSEYELVLESALPATGESQGLNITISYGSLTLPPLRTSFTTGERLIEIEFLNLSPQQTITLPASLEIRASAKEGQISQLRAYAINETGRRIQLAELDPAAPVLAIPTDALATGLFRLLVEAEDSLGNRSEADIFLNIGESLSVRLADVPSQLNLGETLRIEAQIGLAGSVNEVVLLANGEIVATQELGPFDLVSLEWQPSKAGEYRLEVRATDILGSTASQNAQLGVISAQKKNASAQSVLILAGLALLIGVGVTGGTIFLLRRRTPPAPPIIPAAPEPSAQAELQSLNGDRWVLTEGSFTLGRHSSNRIQILDESVSRHHSSIEVQQGRCFYQDNSASHPTEMNGRLLAPEQRYELQDGDQLRIGSTLLKFKRL